jgi:hypothetical protein
LLRLRDAQGRTPLHCLATNAFLELEVGAKLIDALELDTRIEVLKLVDEAGQRACDLVKATVITESTETVFRDMEEPINMLKRLLDPATYDSDHADADDGADSINGFVGQQRGLVLDWLHDDSDSSPLGTRPQSAEVDLPEVSHRRPSI